MIQRTKITTSCNPIKSFCRSTASSGGYAAFFVVCGNRSPPLAAIFFVLRRHPCRNSTLRVHSAALGGYFFRLATVLCCYRNIFLAARGGILLCCCRNKLRRLLSLCGNRKCGIITNLFAELCRNDPADRFAPAESLSTDHRLGIRPKQILTPRKNAADDDHLRIE